MEGQQLSSQGYASYALTVLLPAHQKQLALEIPPVYSAYKLYVNGKAVALNGTTGTSAQRASPQWTTEHVLLDKGTDTLQMILQIANFWHAKGGVAKPIVMGNSAGVLLNYHQHIALDLVLAGCLFMGGLFFWGLSVFGRNDKIIFYFSIFCIIASYRMIGTEPYVLHSLFPQLSWWVGVRLEYLSLVLGVALFFSIHPHAVSKRYHTVADESGHCLLLAIRSRDTALSSPCFYSPAQFLPGGHVPVYCLCFLHLYKCGDP